MPQTRTCDYCGGDIDPGTGTMYVRVDGSVTHFCSSKCEKNAGLGRESRNLEWTESGRGASATAAPEPTVDEPAAEPGDVPPDADEPADGAEAATAGPDEDESVAAADESSTDDADAAPPEDDEDAPSPGT